MTGTVLLECVTIDNLPSKSDAAFTRQSSSSHFFSGEYYEYEIGLSSTSASPTLSSSNEEENIIITETMVPATKTVYLIRHAESEENRRLATLGKSLNGLRKGKLPSRGDVATSMELLNVGGQIDSTVSEVGEKQIKQIGNILREHNFLQVKGIELIAHSPLERVRQTSLGLLGCVAPRYDESNESFPSPPAGVRRIVELDFLKERTPMEWLPVNHDAFTRRIAHFEQWLGEQPENVIVVVGHSQYFKSMLGLDYKFGNCDVWELQFDPLVQLSHESVKMDVSLAERSETNRKFTKKLVKGKERLEESLSYVTAALGSTSPKARTKNNDLISGSPSVLDIQSKNNLNLISEDKKSFSSSSSISEVQNNMFSSDVGNERESRSLDEDDITITDLEISGELPRGWKNLRRLYTYNPKF